MALSGVLNSNITVLAKGGRFNAFNGVGTYRAVAEGASVTSIIDGAVLTGSVNIGYCESKSATNATPSYVKGAVNFIINTDTLTGKNITLTEAKNTGLDLSDGVFTLVFNNGITGYGISDAAKGVLDYIVYAGVGGEAYIHKNGTKTTAPTFLLVPDEGYTPIIGGAFVEETSEGYLYTPEFTGALSTINIGWMSAEEMAPTVYDIDGE